LPKKYRSSIYDYDLVEVRKNLNQNFALLLIMSGMYIFIRRSEPFIIISILSWMNFVTTPLVQIKLLGWKAEGRLSRPWSTIHKNNLSVSVPRTSVSGDITFQMDFLDFQIGFYGRKFEGSLARPWEIFDFIGSIFDKNKENQSEIETL